jgi:hypothetical protein
MNIEHFYSPQFTSCKSVCYILDISNWDLYVLEESGTTGQDVDSGFTPEGTGEGLPQPLAENSCMCLVLLFVH